MRSIMSTARWSRCSPTLQAAFHWDDGDFAHLGSAFQFAAASALIFVGWFIDRLGVRVAYGLAVAVWSLAGMAHAFAASVQQFVAARVILAIGETVSTPAGVRQPRSTSRPSAIRRWAWSTPRPTSGRS
jgi:MFS family permease